MVNTAYGGFKGRRPRTGRGTAPLSRRPLLIGVSVVAAGALVSGAVEVAQAAAGGSSVSAHAIGRSPVVPAGTKAAAAPAANTSLKLDVTLAPSDAEGLRAFDAAVADPQSKLYKHYLSKGQFAARFGATPATVAAVDKALTSAGLKPGPLSADGLSIPVTTTVAGAEKALNVHIAGYTMPDGHHAIANTTAPQLTLPDAVVPAVTGVLGMNSMVAEHAQYVASKHSGLASKAAVKSNAAVSPKTSPAAMCSSLSQALASAGVTDGQQIYSPAALATAYGLNTEYNQNVFGSGITVGIYELENFDPAGISAYQSCFGVHGSVNATRVDGGPTTPADPGNGATGNIGLESALDVEDVLGLAPGATIDVYQGPDAKVATDAQQLDTYRQMVTDDTAQVISTSWGFCELDQNQYDSSYIPSEEPIFAEAAAQGQSVLAASGDRGSTDCFKDGSGYGHDATLSVDDPASQPYVTGAGGTSMSGVSFEPASTVWNNNNQYGSASGGGVSTMWDTTSASYQTGFQGQGYSPACTAASGATCRQVPDVAALADPNHGYLVEYYYGGDATNPAGVYWGAIGGTSGSAPTWASIIALADSTSACQTNGSAGLINNALYTAAGGTSYSSVFADVTSGNNDATASGYTGGLYAAGTGYDMTTGLGSPIAAGVATQVCGATSTSQSAYTPVPPLRVMDTRNGTGVRAGKVGPGQSVTLKVAGANGVPANATAAVFNVTAADADSFSFVTVYPSGRSPSNASNLNFNAGQNVANLVTVPLGMNGQVGFYNARGHTDLIADLAGYYAPSTGSLYTAVSPTRVMDTRFGTGVRKGTVGAGQSVSLQATGTGGIAGVPASATALVLNITATDATSFSFITAYPDGGGVPTASNLNFSAGENRPNLAIVPIGADGKVDFYNALGNVDIIADLAGYYSSTGAHFTPVRPDRLLDTRGNVGAGPVGAGQSVTLTVAGNGPIPANATAVVMNVTATMATKFSFLTVYPAGQGVPTASNLNFTANENIPNLVIVQIGTGGGVNFYNAQGTVNVIGDVAGYFS